MLSFICPIGQSDNDQKRALEEAEKFGIMQHLSQKGVLHLRLLAEELLSMIDNVLEVEVGQFWIENIDNTFKFYLEADAEVVDVAKKVLMEATEKKNQAYEGFSGLLRKAYDAMCVSINQSNYTANFASQDYVTMMDVLDFFQRNNESAYKWSYKDYSNQFELEDKANEWDKIEVSILKKLAEDIVISLRNDTVKVMIEAKLN